MAIRNCKLTNRAFKTSIFYKPWKYLLLQITRTDITSDIFSISKGSEMWIAIYEIGYLISLSIESIYEILAKVYDVT